jgi:hypothetical protein
VLRLVRRDKARYRPCWVHEEMDLPADRVRRLRSALLHYTTWDSSLYCEKLNRYAKLRALDYRDRGRRPRVASLVLSAPARFFYLYVIRRGFLDGIPGFQVCMFAAFYSFMKKARLWEMHHGRPQPDAEVEFERQRLATMLLAETAGSEQSGDRAGGSDGRRAA